MIDPVSAHKREITLAFLLKGATYVHMMPRYDGTRVPSWLRLRDQLAFVIGYALPVPIDDLQISDFGIVCTLAFSGTLFTCRIPWGSVYALTSVDSGEVRWDPEPKDSSPEIAQASRKKPRRRFPSYLRLVQ